jgi:hypothetical protein
VPRPRVNQVVHLRGEIRIVDFAWPEQKVGLELDGLLPHSTRRVFDDDRVSTSCSAPTSPRRSRSRGRR